MKLTAMLLQTIELREIKILVINCNVKPIRYWVKSICVDKAEITLLLLFLMCTLLGWCRVNENAFILKSLPIEDTILWLSQMLVNRIKAAITDVNKNITVKVSNKSKLLSDI